MDGKEVYLKKVCGGDDLPIVKKGNEGSILKHGAAVNDDEKSKLF
jgi:hypothetical protein